MVWFGGETVENTGKIRCRSVAPSVAKECSVNQLQVYMEKHAFLLSYIFHKSRHPENVKSVETLSVFVLSPAGVCTWIRIQTSDQVAIFNTPRPEELCKQSTYKPRLFKSSCASFGLKNGRKELCVLIFRGRAWGGDVRTKMCSVFQQEDGWWASSERAGERLLGDVWCHLVGSYESFPWLPYTT